MKSSSVSKCPICETNSPSHECINCGDYVCGYCCSLDEKGDNLCAKCQAPQSGKSECQRCNGFGYLVSPQMPEGWKTPCDCKLIPLDSGKKWESILKMGIVDEDEGTITF